MKLSIIAILLLFGHTLLVQASEIDIDAQIAKIEQASEEERFRLVNALKQQIARMNANQQAKAIAQYQQETLHIQQQTDLATEMVINNQIQKEQDRQTIVPPIKTIPTTEIEEPKIIVNPKPQEHTPIETPTTPSYQQPITKEPIPVEKPEYIPTPKPIEKPTINTPVEIPTDIPSVQEVQQPQEIIVEKPKRPEPVYVPDVENTPKPKVKPVETPTYIEPPKPSKPSFSKRRF